MGTGMLATLWKTEGVKFANLTYTAKASGEVARHHLILGASQENLYRKDIEVLRAYLATVQAGSVEEQAARELLASREKSLEVGIGNNPAYTCKDVYQDTPVPGVKIHSDGSLHLTGLVEHKTVIVPGTFKKVNSSAKTIAKRKIEKELPSGRFRQFKLELVTRLAANGDVLEIE